MFDKLSSYSGAREIAGMEYDRKLSMYDAEAHIAMIFKKIYDNIKSDSLEYFREDKKYIFFLGYGISADAFGNLDVVTEITDVLLKGSSAYTNTIMGIVENYPKKIKKMFEDFFSRGYSNEREELIKYFMHNIEILSEIIIKLYVKHRNGEIEYNICNCSIKGGF